MLQKLPSTHQALEDLRKLNQLVAAGKFGIAKQCFEESEYYIDRMSSDSLLLRTLFENSSEKHGALEFVRWFIGEAGTFDDLKVLEDHQVFSQLSRYASSKTHQEFLNAILFDTGAIVNLEILSAESVLSMLDFQRLQEAARRQFEIETELYSTKEELLKALTTAPRYSILFPKDLQTSEASRQEVVVTEIEFQQALDDTAIQKFETWKQAGCLPSFATQVLVESQESTSIKQHRQLNICEAAAAFGQLDLLRWYIEDSGQSAQSMLSSGRALQYAVQFRNFEVADWLLAKTTDHSAFFRFANNDYLFLRNLAEDGNIESLKWILEKVPVPLDPTAPKSDIIGCAARGGSLEMVKWLCEESHLSMLKNPAWQNSAVPKIDLAANKNFAVRAAAVNGDLEVLKWILHESGQNVDRADNECEAFHSAIKNGHLEVLKCLLQPDNARRHFQAFYEKEKLLKVAVKSQQFSIFRWLLEESQLYSGAEVHKIVSCESARYENGLFWSMEKLAAVAEVDANSEAVKFLKAYGIQASLEEIFEILKKKFPKQCIDRCVLFIEAGYDLFVEKRIEENSNNGYGVSHQCWSFLDILIKNERYDLLEKVLQKPQVTEARLYSTYTSLRHEEGYGELKKREKYWSCLKTAIEKKSLRAVELICQSSTLSLEGALDALEKAVSSDHFEIFKYLLANSSQLSESTEALNNTVKVAAARGCVEILEFLVKESGLKVDVAANNNLAIQAAAEAGQLTVVKWLVEESGQQVDVTANENKAVRAAARNGHLKVVQWLVNESGQAARLNPAWAGREAPQVDVSAKDNKALRKSAYDKEMIRWLLVESGQLAQILEHSRVGWLDTLPEDLKQIVHNTQVVLEFLKNQQVSSKDYNSYLFSRACRIAIENGLATTKTDLDRILHGSNRKNRRLQML